MTTLKRFKRRTPAPEGHLPCMHPEEKRIDASSMGKPNRWICKRCGFQNWETEENLTPSPSPSPRRGELSNPPGSSQGAEG